MLHGFRHSHTFQLHSTPHFTTTHWQRCSIELTCDIEMLPRHPVLLVAHCLYHRMRYAAAVIDACGWKAIAQWQIANRLLAALKKKKKRSRQKKAWKKQQEIVNMKSKAFGNSAQHKRRIITHLWDSKDKANNRVRLAYQWHCVPGRMCAVGGGGDKNQDMRFSRRLLSNAAYELFVLVFFFLFCWSSHSKGI